MTTVPATPHHAHEQHTDAPGYTSHKYEQHTAAPGYTSHKTDHLARLSKIEGQIRGISRMVTGDRYCIDVLTQISAASHALQEVALGLLDDHVRGCVTDAARTDTTQAEEKFAELNDTLRRALRL
ncbi:metal-sensitive transcriptional regulator [Streptomyces capitiformicae]|uniref:Transcriptional regulator n=1 Tax=Streptomyces capitiformicae TaxID=2014920 RepID=A0A919GJV4_9ACTN|nr:metal-sensitive transcriptional regulator [Streptomyces capitiformicae]GHH85529.1 hypothetical protein GCM10017771_18790 [Streptomyces capitiformicae]